MIRLLGVNLQENNRIEYALTKIYGIGFSLSKKILSQAKVSKDAKVKNLKEEELKRLVNLIEKHKIEGILREEVNANIQRLKQIGSYRGIRHIKGLPTKGQRTRSNARTKRGKKKTVGAFKKEAWAKMEQQGKGKSKK